MWFYFKDSKTFKTKAAAVAAEYSIVEGSIYDDLSEISVEFNEDIADNDIIFNNNGYIGIVQSSEKKDNILNLSCSNILNIFNRDIVYDGTKPTAGVENYLKEKLLENFVNLSDKRYAINYLTISAASETLGNAAPDVTDGICNFKSYAGKIRRLYNIFVEFEVKHTTLNINIIKRDENTKKVVLNNTAVTIEEESISQTNIAKITSYIKDTGATKDWFLLNDGKISNNINDPKRIDGDWIILQISNSAEIENEVRNKFRENSFSHKIVFSVKSSEARFNFYDNLKIELNKKIYNSYVATKTVKSNGLTEYQCGELRTTLTDKIKELI